MHSCCLKLRRGLPSLQLYNWADFTTEMSKAAPWAKEEARVAGQASGGAADAYPSVSAMLAYVLRRQPRLAEAVDARTPLVLPPRAFLALVGFLSRCGGAPGARGVHSVPATPADDSHMPDAAAPEHLSELDARGLGIVYLGFGDCLPRF
jgi:hypothetical protein